MPHTQCAETKGHDRCQDRGPDLCLSSRPSAVIHAGIDMSHLCEYMKFMNETYSATIIHHNLFKYKVEDLKIII